MSVFALGILKSGTARPVKVIFHSNEAAARILQTSSVMKDQPTFRKSFITPDPTPEERAEISSLDAARKEKFIKKPEQYHFTRNGTICNREKVSAPNPQTAPFTPAPSTRTQISSESLH